MFQFAIRARMTSNALRSKQHNTASVAASTAKRELDANTRPNISEGRRRPTICCLPSDKVLTSRSAPLTTLPTILEGADSARIVSPALTWRIREMLLISFWSSEPEITADRTMMNRTFIALARDYMPELGNHLQNLSKSICWH